MANFSSFEHECMSRALTLARRGSMGAPPNPLVGCVLVRDQRIVGEGWHERVGEAHAEVHALRCAGDAASGSTAYVTLEPCAHQGRTGPCVDALISAGVARVVAAMKDPFPQVAGSGFQTLRNAGVDVSTGLCANAAEQLNESYLKRVRVGRPFVRLKTAISLDGRTAMQSGESQWITCDAARADVQRLRMAAGAILTGVGTVVADNPSLTVRDTRAMPAERQPIRVVADSHLKTSPSSKIFSEPGQTMVFCVDDRNRQSIEAVGASVEVVANHNGRVSIDAVLEKLAQVPVNDVLVECGSTLAGELLAADHVDELVIYQAPHIMGSETQAMALTPGWTQLADRLQLDVIDTRALGRDVRITARPILEP